jgi:xanthine dehydrogenase accessory factor
MGVFERLAEMERAGRAVVLATVIRTQGSVPRREGSKMLIFPDGSTEGTIGGGEMESQVVSEALAALEGNQVKTLHYDFRDPSEGDVGVCGGEMDVYIEPLPAKSKIIVVGAGHVGRSIAHLASWLGFQVHAVDDRPGFASRESIPDAVGHHHCAIEEIPRRISVNENTYIILTTRNAEIDIEGLPSLLDTPAAYIGVIGSRRRWETTAQALAESGIQTGQIERVVSPMGLEIQAETPEEIAVSIMAQIIMRQRGGSGEPMAHTVVGKVSWEGE